MDQKKLNNLNESILKVQQSVELDESDIQESMYRRGGGLDTSTKLGRFGTMTPEEMKGSPNASGSKPYRGEKSKPKRHGIKSDPAYKKAKTKEEIKQARDQWNLKNPKDLWVGESVLEVDEDVVKKGPKLKIKLGKGKKIGTKIADIGPGGKEHNVKTDAEWDAQKAHDPMKILPYTPAQWAAHKKNLKDHVEQNLGESLYGGHSSIPLKKDRKKLKLPRQLKDKKSEMMVTSPSGKTFVIYKSEWEKHKASGHEVAEALNLGESHDSRELHLFTSNHPDVHRQRTKPVHKNLINKMAKGTYDTTKAHKAFMHIARDGSKAYDKAHGHKFDKDTIHQTATTMQNEFESEAKDGQHDHHLYKKYKSSAVTKKEDTLVRNYFNTYFGGSLNESTDDQIMEAVHDLVALRDAVLEAVGLNELRGVTPRRLKKVLKRHQKRANADVSVSLHNPDGTRRFKSADDAWNKLADNEASRDKSRERETSVKIGMSKRGIKFNHRDGLKFGR